MRSTPRCMLLAALVSTSPALADVHVGRGGDLIECRPGGVLSGTFALDFVATYSLRTANADIIAATDGRANLERIATLLEAKHPPLGASLRAYLQDFENFSDPTRTRRWVEAPFGVVEIEDEGMVHRLPPHCGDVTPDGRVRARQVIIRRVAGTNLEYHVDRDLFDRLRNEAPLQFSFLALHEWGWDLTDDPETLRQFVRLMHSRAAVDMTPDQLVAAVGRLNIRSAQSTVDPVARFYLDTLFLGLALDDRYGTETRDAYRSVHGQIGEMSRRAREGAPFSVLQTRFLAVKPAIRELMARYHAAHATILDDDIESTWGEFVAGFRQLDAIFAL